MRLINPLFKGKIVGEATTTADKKQECGGDNSFGKSVEEECEWNMASEDSILEAQAEMEALAEVMEEDVPSRRKLVAVVVPRRNRNGAAASAAIEGNRQSTVEHGGPGPRSMKRVSMKPQRFGELSQAEAPSRKQVPVPAAATSTPKVKKYKVEKILDRKSMKGKVHYLVKWQGYPASHNTWEWQKTLKADVPEVVAEFEGKRKKKEATYEPDRRGPGKRRTETGGRGTEETEGTARIVHADRDDEDGVLYYYLARRGAESRLSAAAARANYPLAVIAFYETIVRFETD